ncbi:hypothetical protein [Neobacillus citreus]|uniref:Uncharacterized protein n=2 Tax=Neobacillus TaxID=2675232 RepID=A0A942YBI1_9BACI|nr:hypothetical protein [Neobacillus citreus]MCH6264307.1 hypothetical protein [Neobacillus citreus]
MDENVVENNNPAGMNVDLEKLKNLTGNLGNQLDMNSLMQMATTLLKNDSFLTSVAGLSKLKLPASLAPNAETSIVSQSQENSANVVTELQKVNEMLSSLNNNLENISNVVKELKQQNEILSSMAQKLDNITNDNSGFYKLFKRKSK